MTEIALLFQAYIRQTTLSTGAARLTSVVPSSKIVTVAMHTGTCLAVFLLLAAPPAQGPDALALLAPLARGGTLEGGWMLEDVQTHPEYMRFFFARETAPACKASFELTARNPAYPGLVPLESYSLFLLEHSCPALPKDLVGRLGALIAKNEKQEKNIAKLVPPRTYRRWGLLGLAGTWCPVFLLLGIVLLALALADRSVRERVFPHAALSPGWAAGLIPLLVVALAAALRLLDSPLTIANVNAHAYDWIRSAMDGIHGGYGRYGNGYPNFFHALMGLGIPRSGEAIMTVNAVLGALSAGALCAFVLAAFKDRWAALFAAVLWAVLPAHVRLSSSEDFPALLSLSQILAALAAVAAARSPGWRTFAAVACLVLFSVQVRPEGWFVVPAAALLFVSAAGWATLKRTARMPSFWVIFLLAAAAAVGPLLGLRDALSSAENPLPPVELFSMRTARALFLAPFGSPEGIGNLSLNPFYTPPTLAILAALGAAAYWKNHRAFILALAASYLLLAWTVVAFQLGIIPTVRLQVSYQWTLTSLSGAGFAWLTGRTLKDRFAGVVLAIFVLAALSYVPYRGFVRRLYAPQLEYAFLKDAMRKIPDRCTLVHLDANVGTIATALPTWIPENEGKKVATMEISTFLKQPAGGYEGCFAFYRGLTCFTFPSGGKGPPEQPFCSALGKYPFSVLASRTITPLRAENSVYRLEALPLEMRLLHP